MMTLTKENIAQLVRLQEQDKILDGIKAALDKIPVDIERIQKSLETEKSGLNQIKAKANQLQLAKKEKEAQVQQKEDSVRKHGEELNKVKTNDAYKALLSEIDKAKTDISDLETAILMIMEETDQAVKEEKTASAQLKEHEAKNQKEIESLRSREIALKGEFDSEKSKRDSMTAGLPDDAMRQYDYLRRRKPDGEALARVNGNACGNCRITIPAQVIVEMAKGRLVTCEACQRILYSDAPIAEKAKTA